MTNQSVDRSEYWARLRGWRHIPSFLALTWRASRGYTAAMVLLRGIRAVLPVAVLWVGKAIIDQIVGVMQTGAATTLLWRYVALEIALVVATEVLARASALVESLLGEILTDNVSVRLMEHAARLDLEDFENPVVYDSLERARQQAADSVGPLSQLLTILQDVVTLAGLAVVVCSYSLWLGLLLIAAVVPMFASETYFSMLDYLFTVRTTPQRRLLAYLRWVAATSTTAKEVRTLDLGPWLARRHRRLAAGFLRERAAMAVRKNGVAAAWSLLGVVGYYVAYVAIIGAAIRREISLGYLTMLAASFARTRELALRVLLAAGELHQKSLHLQDLFAFFEMRPRIDATRGTTPVRVPVLDGVVFDNVSFRYAGSDRWALRHVNFRLRPRECLALVGENGAGKTTIAKLLARLYEPTEGRILLDGRDIREYDLASLRRAVSLLFQDFVRYEMHFDENVGIGSLEEAAAPLEAVEQTDGAVAPELVPLSIRRASERSFASTIAARLPAGYRQMLGRFFKGGLELSGGEWQKIALARTYMRVESAEILILDEPTAALDARAEALVFEQFRALARQRASILISHRFSTVRMADRIVVLGGGEIIDAGTHDELIARRGLYAELFELQAAGYQ